MDCFRIQARVSNQADTQKKNITHELVILTKFYKDWQEIVDFLAIAKSLPSLNFFAPVFIMSRK